MTKNNQLKQINEQLQGSCQDDNFLQLAAKLAGFAYWVWDEQKNCLISISEEYARIIGQSTDQVLQLYANKEDDHGLIHDEDRARYVRDTRARSYNIEYRIVRADNSVRYVREIGDSLLDDDGQMLISYGSLQDITERRMVEISLRESEERFRDFARAASDWYWEMDAELRLPFFPSVLTKLTA